MRRNLLVLTSALLLLVIPAGVSWTAPNGTFSGSASAVALEISVKAGNVNNPQGLSAGVSAVEGRSTPFAKARGAGQCEALAPAETLMTLPCTAGSTEQVEVTGSGEQNPDPNPFKCAASQGVPAVLSVGTACGNALARVTGSDPFADGRGTVGLVELVTVPQLPIPIPLPPSPRAVALQTGPTVSTFKSEGQVVKARADASGGVIVVAGITQDVNGQPDGAVIIELGDAFAEASWDGTSPLAKSDFKGQILSIRVKQTNGTYQAVDPPIPGQSMTLLAGTPMQTTVTAASGTKSESTSGLKGTAVSSATAVRIWAAQGIGGTTGNACLVANCDGGIDLKFAIASAQIDGELPIVPQLAITGPGAILAILGIAGIVLAVRLVRSLRRRTNPA